VTTPQNKCGKIIDRIVFLAFLGILSIAAVETAHAQSFEDRLLELEQRWAYASYELDGKQQKIALGQVLGDARAFAATHPDRAEALAWHGIIASRCIDTGCAFRKSRLAVEARDALLQAESLTQMAPDGVVYANLGALYSKVPGGIIGFGDHNKAIYYLWKAVAVDPNGFDSNFLYAEVLFDNKQYVAARKRLLKAQIAATGHDRTIADHGRQRRAGM
jgi:tetratricopeptide (TPR) repeat protein